MTLQRERRPPHRGAAHNNPSTTTKAEGSTSSGGAARYRYEYRLTWRRQDWTEATKSKSRTFARRSDAEALHDKLTGDQRPELSPLTVLQVDVRRVGVGPWSRTTL